MSTLIEQVYPRIEDVPPAPTVATVGAFDGVHRGHQHLLRRAREAADGREARLLVVTFEPLPGQVFRPDQFPGRITTSRRRRELLFRYGADVIVELRFDRVMAHVTASQFMEQLMNAGPLLELWTGEDFALGYKREGTPDRLQEITHEHGTVVHVVDRIDLGGMQVSSTGIRRLISEGRADEVARLLGHRFQVAGTVVRGAQLGRQIGFPTANVAPPEHLVQLQDGIYATLAGVEGEGRLRPAMTYIGTRPAVNTGQRMIETHLFDFEGDLYDRTLVTEFVEHLRQDENFPNMDALVAQLRQDETMARSVLGAQGGGGSVPPR